MAKQIQGAGGNANLRKMDCASQPYEMPTLEVEQARYRRAWAMLDRASVSFWLSVLATLPIVIVANWITQSLGGPSYAVPIILFGWLILRWLLGWGKAYWNFECPRCHKFFFNGDGRSSYVSGRCINCGLPRGALPPYFEPEV